MAFGGAGPLFATLLAQELDIEEIVIPPYAGNFSAWGLLGSDLTRSAARTRIAALSPESIEESNAILADLFDGLEQRSNGAAGEARREVGLDMRYAGQEHTLTIAVPSEDGRVSAGRDEIYGLFTRDYERTFALTMEEEVEIVSVRATLRTPLPRRAHAQGVSNGDRRSAASVEAYSFTRDEVLPFTVVERAALGPDAELEGPAIVIEETSTTYVDADYVARVQDACLLMRRVA
jgi:N-methylhydantoinase A